MYITAKNFINCTYRIRHQFLIPVLQSTKNRGDSTFLTMKKNGNIAQPQLPARTLATCNRFYAADHTEGLGVYVNHDETNGEFYIDLDDGRAFLQYIRLDNIIRLMHTEVPSELEGRGLGRILAKEALDYVVRNNYQLQIECDFVRHFVTKYEPKYIKYLQEYIL